MESNDIYRNKKGLYSIRLNNKRLTSEATYSDLIELNSILTRVISLSTIKDFKSHLLGIIAEVTNIPIDTVLKKNSRKADIVTVRHFIHYFEYLFYGRYQNSLITLCTKGAIINSVEKVEVIIKYKYPSKYYIWYESIKNKLNE